MHSAGVERFCGISMLQIVTTARTHMSDDGSSGIRVGLRQSRILLGSARIPAAVIERSTLSRATISNAITNIVLQTDNLYHRHLSG